MASSNATAIACAHCGVEIFRIQNPEGAEVWSEEPDGGAWGCLQAAFDQWDGTGDEPEAPYPPHAPEACTVCGVPAWLNPVSDHMEWVGHEWAPGLSRQ
jgi:hypothetical protein